jgi:hypothetical protein
MNEDIRAKFDNYALLYYVSKITWDQNLAPSQKIAQNAFGLRRRGFSCAVQISFILIR